MLVALEVRSGGGDEHWGFCVAGSGASGGENRKRSGCGAGTHGGEGGCLDLGVCTMGPYDAIGRGGVSHGGLDGEIAGGDFSEGERDSGRENAKGEREKMGG